MERKDAGNLQCVQKRKARAAPRLSRRLGSTAYTPPQAKHTDLIEESDRGCVLVAAAMLEEGLEKIFRATFESKRASKTLQDSLFDSNGPLATFSAKIKLAYALALISSDAHEDLEEVRRLRNEAAHTARDFDFLDDSVGRRVESIHCVQRFRGSFKRYSPKYHRRAEGSKAGRHADQSDSGVRVRPKSEAHLRVAGFLKYRKAIFALGVGDLVFGSSGFSVLVMVTHPTNS